MKTAERLFCIALALQLIHVAVSFVPATDWLLTAVFCLWVALVPVIGFVIGRAAGTGARAGRLAATLALSWFFLGALSAVFDRTIPPNLWLTGLAGFAIACLVGGAVLVMVTIVFAKVGARTNAAA